MRGRTAARRWRRWLAASGWAGMAGHGQISDGSRMRPGFEGSDGEARRLGLAWMRGVGDWMMHGLKAASRPWALGGAAGHMVAGFWCDRAHGWARRGEDGHGLAVVAGNWKHRNSFLLFFSLHLLHLIISLSIFSFQFFNFSSLVSSSARVLLFFISAVFWW